MPQGTRPVLDSFEKVESSIQGCEDRSPLPSRVLHCQPGVALHHFAELAPRPGFQRKLGRSNCVGSAACVVSIALFQISLCRRCRQLRKVVDVGEVDENGDMVAGLVAFPLISRDVSIGNCSSESVRTENEIYAHPLIAGESQLLIVPVRVSGWHPGPHDILVSDVEKTMKSGPFGRGDVSMSLEKLFVPDVTVKGRDIPVAHECNLFVRSLLDPGGSAVGQRPQPLEFVHVMGIIEFAAIRHVEIPKPESAETGAQRARLAFAFRAPPWHAFKFGSYIRGGNLARECDPIPLVYAVHRHFITSIVEGCVWELRFFAFDLLHGEYVDVGMDQPRRDALYPRTNRVHIPGRNSHDYQSKRAQRSGDTLECVTARDNLIRYINELAVFHGDFTLTSGTKANFYVDLRRVSLDHRAAPLLGRVMCDLIADIPSIAAVGGLTMGADPIALAILHQGAARGQAYDAFVVRKEPKDHGRGRQVEGPELAGKRVVVVEDTSTTGGSPLRAAAALEKVGAQVVAVAVVVDRKTGAKDAIESAGYLYRAAISVDELDI